LSPAQRAAWLELAALVDAAGTFAAPDLGAFKLLVLAWALAWGIGPETPPSAAARYLSVAAGLLQRFGLDPGSRGRVPQAAPRNPARELHDLFASGGAQ
jgi:hypothetical protein